MQVAVLGDPVEHLGRLEDQPSASPAFDRRLHLVPGHRRRHGRLRPGPQGVDRDGGLELGVLAPVDQDPLGRTDLSWVVTTRSGCALSSTCARARENGLVCS